jgi:hypothetical protein
MQASQLIASVSYSRALCGSLQKLWGSRREVLDRLCSTSSCANRMAASAAVQYTYILAAWRLNSWRPAATYGPRRTFYHHALQLCGSPAGGAGAGAAQEGAVHRHHHHQSRGAAGGGPAAGAGQAGGHTKAGGAGSLWYLGKGGLLRRAASAGGAAYGVAHSGSGWRREQHMSAEVWMSLPAAAPAASQPAIGFKSGRARWLEVGLQDREQQLQG